MYGRYSLNNDQRFALIQAIGYYSAHRGYDQKWDLTSKGDEAKQQWRTGCVVYQPNERNTLTPDTNQGGALAGQENPIIPIAKRPQGMYHLNG